MIVFLPRYQIRDSTAVYRIHDVLQLSNLIVIDFFAKNTKLIRVGKYFIVLSQRKERIIMALMILAHPDFDHSIANKAISAELV